MKAKWYEFGASFDTVGVNAATSGSRRGFAHRGKTPKKTNRAGWSRGVFSFGEIAMTGETSAVLIELIVRRLRKCDAIIFTEYGLFYHGSSGAWDATPDVDSSGSDSLGNGLGGHPVGGHHRDSGVSVRPPPLAGSLCAGIPLSDFAGRRGDGSEILLPTMSMEDQGRSDARKVVSRNEFFAGGTNGAR